MRDRVTGWIGVVGVLAVVAGLVVGYLALRPDSEPSRRVVAEPVQSRAFVSKAGGFSLQVPRGMKVTRAARSARFTSRDKSLVASVGPAGPAPVRASTARLLQRLRATYSRVRVLGHRTDRVDGRRARTTYGTASNADKVPLRFVLVVVPAGKRTYALTTFTSSPDAARIVPLVNRLNGSFQVR